MRDEAHPRRRNRGPSKADRGTVRGSRKETAVSPLHRKGTAVPLRYFPTVTSWVLQKAIQRARGFKASGGAVGWSENPHLGKVRRYPRSQGVGRNAQGKRQPELQLGSRRRERWPTLLCLYRGKHSEPQAAQVGSLWSGLD